MSITNTITANIKPCIIILNYNNYNTLQEFIKNTSKFCEHLYYMQSESMAADNVNAIAIHTKQKGLAILEVLAKAKENNCTHIITLEVCDSDTDNLEQLLQEIQKQELSIVIGLRDFTKQKAPLHSRFERQLSSFWMRVQTSIKLQDMHSNTKAYPIELFDFIKIREKDYAFDTEILVKAAWAGFNIVEVPINAPILKVKPRLSDHARMIALNTQFTMRALVPLPFRRFDRGGQNAISLRHPVLALRQLMNDPYNRATPWQLARTAGISMAILTVPAPIIQSIFLLLSIGWLRLNRLCAIAMIPLTWPPFLPGIAILVGYRVRHGEWLTEFSIQTLGYEVGQRALEWVIGSLALTPILGLALGLIVGLAAWAVNKQ